MLAKLTTGRSYFFGQTAFDGCVGKMARKFEELIKYTKIQLGIDLLI
jgi:hypothetical protein